MSEDEIVQPVQPVVAVAISHKEEILFVGFNQDQGCFTVGTSHGFRIFNTYPFKDTFNRGNINNYVINPNRI